MASTHPSNPVPLIINGRDVTMDMTFVVRNPTTGKEIWTSSSVSEEDALDAVSAAEKAFPSWSKTKQSYRRDLFLRAADIMTNRKDELAIYMREEIGATDQYIDFIFGLAIEQLRDTAGRISGIHGVAPELIDEGTQGIIYKQPYGVILGIGPWNAPYHLGLRAVSFALATGNTTVLKGPEFSPRCYWAIADVFREAGLPDGCLNLIFHRPQDAARVTQALIAHPSVKKINFTGSTAVGSIIASLAGKHLKPVLMELGGKASAIVLRDADLGKAAQHCTMGAFINAGQVCMSTERILVHSSIVTAFQEAFTQTISQLFGATSPPLAVICTASAAKNRALVSDAVQKGATVLYGDVTAVEDVETRMLPVVVGNVTKDMDIFRIESFGPTVSLYTFDTEEEAVALANDTEYGLAAAVFTEDLKAGLRVARALDSGAVHINSMTVHDEFSLPHGGCKKSGFGRFNGQMGLEEFLWTKSVTWNE